MVNFDDSVTVQKAMVIAQLPFTDDTMVVSTNRVPYSGLVRPRLLYR